MNKDNSLESILIQKAADLHRKPREQVPFSNNPEVDHLINNIEEYPHFFILGSVVNRQMKAWRVWLIPFIISEDLNSREFSEFYSKDADYYRRIFFERSLHRMPVKMASVFFNAIQKIHIDYDDNASQIWKLGNPNAGDVIKRLDQFDGVGQKISNMVVNILVREFKVKLSNYQAIDVSIDVHIRRVFRRLGFVDSEASDEDIIRKAREIYPPYPGIFDSLCWEIGEAWCRPSNPECNACFLEGLCPKNPVV